MAGGSPDDPTLEPVTTAGGFCRQRAAISDSGSKTNGQQFTIYKLPSASNVVMPCKLSIVNCELLAGS